MPTRIVPFMRRSSQQLFFYWSIIINVNVNTKHGRTISPVFTNSVHYVFRGASVCCEQGLALKRAGMFYICRPRLRAASYIFIIIAAKQLWGSDMGNKTAFIGHREVFSGNIEERLRTAIEEQIAYGCKFFTMGTHGEFDEMALSACRAARQSHPEIKIEVVLTSYHIIERKNEFDFIPYQDVETVMYDIENEHFKRKITISNRQMIDNCDTLICYVDKKISPSGAKRAMNYAKRKGLKIINLFRQEDDPTFGMTSEQKQEYWNKILSEICNK